MELTDMLRIIDQRLKELGLSDHKASMASGHPDAIKNLRKAAREGKGGPTMQTLIDLARALEINAAAFLEGGEGIQDPYTNAITRLRAKIAAMQEALGILEEERAASVKKPK